MKEQVYVTYELEELRYPSVRCVEVRGQMVCWNVGCFQGESGGWIRGVCITFTRMDDSIHELVEIPAGAQNVQVHIGDIPRIYEQAFDAAV